MTMAASCGEPAFGRLSTSQAAQREAAKAPVSPRRKKGEETVAAMFGLDAPVPQTAAPVLITAAAPAAPSGFLARADILDGEATTE